MTEFIGLAYFAEIPATIINVQRGGPSTGMPTRTQQADLLACAYASHGDTKHVLLFPEDPHECFEFAAAALDLADRLQTPVFLMTDLDIGMNQRLCDAVRVGRQPRSYDRGKVMTRRGTRGRQGLRPLPRRRRRRHSVPHLSRHAPAQGAYFTRGTTKDAYARYSEAGPDYIYNVERLLKKFETANDAGAAAGCCARPRRRLASASSTSARPARRWTRRSKTLERQGIHRRCACASAPFRSQRRSRTSSPRTKRCSSSSRTATRSCARCWSTSCEIDPARLVPVLHYDGTPITARFIIDAIARTRARR